jgi:hypothetical protein
VLSLALSCATPKSGTSEVPEHGLGMLGAEPTPPAGAEVFDAPQFGQGQALGAGTELLYRRRGDRIAHFRLELPPTTDAELESSKGWNLVDQGTGIALRYDDQWMDLGKDLPEGNGPMLILDPGDPILDFPLWVGKSWKAHFVSRAERRGPFAVEVAYQCDAVEWVSTPAGKFRCLRIWRRAQLAAPIESYATQGEADVADVAAVAAVAEGGEPRQRTSLYWYAPDLGFVVKRLDDSELLELIEIRR